MALSEPRILYGIHSFTPYSRTTQKPFGILKVLAGSSMALTGELVKLNGGSAKYAWAVEDGLIAAEVTLKPKEYPDFLFELFLGKAPTANAAETAGSTTTLTDKKGTVVDGTTGIASVDLKSGSSADLKFASYIIEVISTTTVDVFLQSDIDITRGTDAVYQNDLLKITASALTVPGTSATVEIPGTGIDITGGSGTVDLTTAGLVGDTAIFSTRPNNSKSMDVTIGSTSDLPPEFGALMIGQQRGNGEMMEIDAFKCKGVGLPLNMEENAFSEAEIKVEAFYDSVKDGVFAVRHVTPT